MDHLGFFLIQLPFEELDIRGNGPFSLFAYGSKHNAAWLKLYAHQSVHPTRGRYLTVEPFMQEMIDQLVTPKVRILAIMHTGDCDLPHKTIVKR